MHKAFFYKKLKNKTVKCLACNHYCVISENNVGLCGVRQNIKGSLCLAVYGSAAAIHTDPIEKKPLFHFLPGSKIFSLGTVGCNFYCSFCQNADISQQARELKFKLIKEKRLGDFALETEKFGYRLEPQQIVDFCLENNISAIAYTYNEPAIFFEYAYDTMKLAKKKKIKNVFVSNGYISKEAILKLKGLLDAINIDLKSFSEDFYRKICGARLLPVLENIKRFHKMGIWVEVTTLIVPGQNDSEAELSKIAKFLKSVSPDIPWHISRFYPQYKMLKTEATPIKTLEKAYQIGKKAGLNYVYVGNIPLVGKEDTYCPKCKNLLINRGNYNVYIEKSNFDGNKCLKCGTKIKGVWQ